jgi:D-alanine-D-alanine ligase-like ATP-grasp enzyme
MGDASNKMRLLVVMTGITHADFQTERDQKYKRMLGIYDTYGFETSLTLVYNLEDLERAISQFMPDLVLCGVDHLPYTSGGSTVQEVRSYNVHEWFEEHAINYIGSDPVTIERVLSKSSLKGIWKNEGVRTPTFGFVQGEPGRCRKVIDELVTINKFPYILKPNNLGNSKGIAEKNIVWNKDELSRAVDRLLDLERTDLLVEHYLGAYKDFKEITCAMIEGSKGMTLMPGQLSLAQPRENPIITTADKDNHRTLVTRLESHMREAFLSFADRAFSVSGVRDYARGDFIYANKVFWAIEINGQPMIPDSWFEATSYLSGLSESQYLVGIVAAGYRRLKAEGLIGPDFPQEAKTLLQGTAIA